MAKAKGPSCRSATSAGPGLKWECSLPTGHKGMHAAKGVSGMVLHRWKRRITPPAYRPTPGNQHRIGALTRRYSS